MDEKDFAQKSLTLSFEFQRYLIAHPEIAEKIPKEAQILFVLQDDPAFTERERGLSEKVKEEGRPVVFVKVEKIMPPFESRLVNPHVESISVS